MTKQGNDYAYLNELDAEGWAWEFMRRGEPYRAAYTPFKKLRDQHGDDWHKKQEVVHVPKKRPKESENAWNMRLAEQGVQPRKLTPSQKCAQAQWSLHDMYDPAMRYDPEIIRFMPPVTYPVFYGNPVTISAKRAKGKTVLGLRHSSTIEEDLDELLADECLLVALNPRRPIPAQTKKIKAMLIAYAGLYEQPKPSRNRKDVWPLYVKFLDLLDVPNPPSDRKILLVVDTTKSTRDLDVTSQTKKAYDTKKSAVAMAHHGYADIIRGRE